jgi:hypothetical protein
MVVHLIVQRHKILCGILDTLDKFDKTKKFYYIPLSGFIPQFTKLQHNVDALKQLLNRTAVDELKVDVHGVRKGDIETIKKMPNWINLEEHIITTMNALNTKNRYGIRDGKT